MFKDVKSIFILKKNFSLLNEKRKLNLIRYNKNLQKLIGINILNYMYYKEAKKIGYTKHGIMKDYDNENKLRFEGEYIYGFKISGKEYINGRLEYEGEYYYNKKWNGKGYDENGNIIYELINGKGKVKEFDTNGILEFEGEYLKGEKSGKGIIYYSNGKILYEGNFLNDKKNGKGKEYNYKGKIEFDGEYRNGERMNGKIKEYDFDDIKLVFEGEYLNGKINGKGIEYDSNGKKVFEGEYLDGKKNGKCKHYSYGKLIFEGEYKDGKKNGKAKEYNNDYKLIFEGEYLDNNRWNGVYKDYYPGKLILSEGVYSNGRKIIKKKYEENIKRIKYSGNSPYML